MATARTRGVFLGDIRELLLTGVVEEGVEEEEEAEVAWGVVVEGVAGVEVEVSREEQTVSVFKEF